MRRPGPLRKDFQGSSTPMDLRITVGSIKLTSKGRLPKDYQTPYGLATVDRHVYQSPQGGVTYCPLDRDSCENITMLSPKHRQDGTVVQVRLKFGSARVQHDLRDHHGRAVSRCLVQDIADAVAAVALAKEEDWSYHLPRRETAPSHRHGGLEPGRDLAARCARTGGARRWSGRSTSTTDRHETSWRRRPNMARRRSWADWKPRWRTSRRRIPACIAWGSPMGRRGIGNSWSAPPSRSWTSGTRRSIWARRRRCCTAVIRRRVSRGSDTRCHELKHDPGATAILKRLKSLAKVRQTVG